MRDALVSGTRTLLRNYGTADKPRVARHCAHAGARAEDEAARRALADALAQLGAARGRGRGAAAPPRARRRARRASS